MDTVITMKAHGDNALSALHDAADELYRLEALFSVTDPNSEIALLSSGGNTVSQETADLLKKASVISSDTLGAYDFTVAPLMNLWGWYQGEMAVPTERQIQETLSIVGWEKVKINGTQVVFTEENMGIDLGGIAKGYAADCLVKIMKKHGVESALLNLGGNICAVGTKPDKTPWIIGVDDPKNANAYLATIAVTDSSVVTSGSYQRFFMEDGSVWHHILDPETGYPADTELQLVTVVAKDHTLADGLSTALFVMGLEDAAAFWRSDTYTFDAVFVKNDGSIYITQGLEQNFSCQLDYEVIMH